MEISCKLFTDDIEEALQKLNHTRVDLARSGENKMVHQQVRAYLQERLHVVINGIPSKLELVGFETENDITWFYLESTVEVPKTTPVNIKLSNSLLYDFLPHQTNVVQVIWNGQERTDRLVNPEKDSEFKF
jgi:hypothetical protein